MRHEIDDREKGSAQSVLFQVFGVCCVFCASQVFDVVYVVCGCFVVDAPRSGRKGLVLGGDDGDFALRMCSSFVAVIRCAYGEVCGRTPRRVSVDE